MKLVDYSSDSDSDAEPPPAQHTTRPAARPQTTDTAPWQAYEAPSSPATARQHIRDLTASRHAPPALRPSHTEPRPRTRDDERLLQLARLKSPAHRPPGAPPVHVNQRIAATAELGEPGWLAEKLRGIDTGSGSSGVSIYAPGFSTLLPSQDDLPEVHALLAESKRSRLQRTKVSFVKQKNK